MDMRGQGYDNGANMKGKHNGLQKRILNINSRAFFVPCAAHSLNLVVNDGAKSSLEITNFFAIIQEIYVFFSLHLPLAYFHERNSYSNCKIFILY
jgi:hypothetical protein